MKKLSLFIAIGIIISASFVLFSNTAEENNSEQKEEDKTVIEFEAPRRTGPVSVEEALFNRVSTRNFAAKSLQKDDVGQLLWSATGKTVQGVTGATRTYPSAGGNNPLYVYAVVSEVEDIPKGLYRYNWKEHSLELLSEGDHRSSLMDATFNQRMVERAPFNIVLSADMGRSSPRSAAMDVGAAGQNVHLQAEALNLGTVIVGAFNAEEVKKVLQLSEGEEPLYIMPIGHFPKEE